MTKQEAEILYYKLHNMIFNYTTKQYNYYRFEELVTKGTELILKACHEDYCDERTNKE